MALVVTAATNEVSARSCRRPRSRRRTPLSGRAPTPEEARALADGLAEALIAYAEENARQEGPRLGRSSVRASSCRSRPRPPSLIRSDRAWSATSSAAPSWASLRGLGSSLLYGRRRSLAPVAESALEVLLVRPARGDEVAGRLRSRLAGRGAASLEVPFPRMRLGARSPPATANSLRGERDAGAVESGAYRLCVFALDTAGNAAVGEPVPVSVAPPARVAPASAASR